MEDEGDVATAFTLARSLSHIPISRGGPTSLVIFDIHALQVTEIRPYHPVDFFTCSFFFKKKSLTCVYRYIRRDSTLETRSCRVLRVASRCWKLGFRSYLILIT
jgi:hypothetical protein